MDEEEVYNEETGVSYMKRRNERIVQESEEAKKYLENYKMTDLSVKIDEMFNDNLKKLMRHMNKSHANYEQNLMNLYQKLDYYGYYSRLWNDAGIQNMGENF